MNRSTHEETNSETDQLINRQTDEHTDEQIKKKSDRVQMRWQHLFIHNKNSFAKF